MQIKKIIFTYILVLFSSLVYSQKGYVQDLNHFATIIFPDTPTVVKYPDYQYKMSDSTLKYKISISKNIYIVKLLFFKKDLEPPVLDIYNSFIDGVKNDDKRKLFYKKDINLNGLRGIEFCSAADYSQYKYYEYYQFFIFNGKYVTLSYLSLDSLKGKSDSKAFFNTFKLTIKKNDIKQNISSESTTKTNTFEQVFLIIALLIMLGFTIVFILKKLIYK